MNFDSELEKEYIHELETMLETQLGAEIVERYGEVPLGNKYTPDFYCMLKLGQLSTPMLVEVKSDVSTLSQLKKFTDFARGFDALAILVATTISEKVKTRLKEDAIGYYEVNRELYFPFQYFFENHTGRASKAIEQKGFRAESSLKLLLYFVCKPESLNFTQRELSEKLDISLGAINKSLNDLSDKGLIIVRGKDRFLGRFEEIVGRWRISFADHFKKNFIIGTFSPVGDDFHSTWRRDYIWNAQHDDKDWTGSRSKDEKHDIYWGGEAAAAIKTDYLTPELFQIYTYNDNITSIIKNLYLKKDPNGIIKIAKCFWPQELNLANGTVPDFVVYCELLNSGIDRNLETAKMLEKTIRDRLKQYEY